MSRPGRSLRTPDMGEQGTPVGRRVFLGLLGLGAAGVVAGASAQGWLERNVAPIIGRDPTGLLSLLPIGRFRIYTVTGGLPNRSRQEYRLRVHGLVDEPFELSFSELTDMKPTELVRDFQCVTGWRVSTVSWKGVRLQELLDRAGVSGDARAVRPSTAPTPRASPSRKRAATMCSLPTSSTVNHSRARTADRLGST
jgi:DMSO/TMAO reductase YedYZ molybdopterin-dependent catalytic subunit